MWFFSVDVKIDQWSRISGTAYKRASFVDCSPRFVRSDVWTDLAKRLANPSLGLCHGVFTSWFIFRCILEHLLQQKWKLRSIFERTRSIIYENKRYWNVKNTIRRFCGLVCGTEKIFYWNSRQISLKISCLVKTPWNNYMKVACSGLWARLLCSSTTPAKIPCERKAVKWATKLAIKKGVQREKESEKERSKKIRKHE